MANSPDNQDRKARKPTGRSGHKTFGSRSDRSTTEDSESSLIFGIHPVEAVLKNPTRTIYNLYLTQNAENRLATALAAHQQAPNRVSPKDLDRRLGPDTVHQGALVECSELLQPALSDVVATAKQTGKPLVLLDQVTDPHNVGAILRSCAVFGCAGLIMTRRHSPPLSGTVAKSASGALELVPIVLIQNLVKAVETLVADGINVIGLEGTATGSLETVLNTMPTAIVLGAEGRGLRVSTSAACSTLCRIATDDDGPISSLNVSNAAAITLHFHALSRQRNVVN